MSEPGDGRAMFGIDVFAEVGECVDYVVVDGWLWWDGYGQAGEVCGRSEAAGPPGGMCREGEDLFELFLLCLLECLVDMERGREGGGGCTPSVAFRARSSGLEETEREMEVTSSDMGIRERDQRMQKINKAARMNCGYRQLGNIFHDKCKQRRSAMTCCTGDILLLCTIRNLADGKYKTMS